MTDLISGNRHPSQPALAVLGMVAGSFMMVHGIARASLGIVGDFGGFLEATGFPLGGVLAWIITIVEIVGGLSLVAGLFVRPLAIWFAAQLMIGIVLVHAPEGWFVVGAGRNGMEYSVLLIAVFVAVAYARPFAWSIRARREAGGGRTNT